MSEEIKDPGIGTQFSKSTKRIINPNGTYNVRKKGVRRGLRDFFRFLIEISWLKFFGFLFLGYIGMNIVFACLYLAFGVDGIGGIPAGSNSSVQAFFFSIQTFTTVGYGGMAPLSLAAQIIAGIEAFVGFLSFALATGLLYGRFSRPLSRIIYSDNILFSKHKDANSFKLKLANERDSVLLELDANVIATFDEMDSEGTVLKKYFRLPLEISTISMMPFSWTLVHPINAESPFHDMTQEEILNANIEFLVMVKGYSEVFGTVVHSRKSYAGNEILWNKNFKKIFHAGEDGTVEMDIRDINQMEDE